MWMDLTAWDKYAGDIIAHVDANPEADGVLLSLHGAMVTEATDDAEGDPLTPTWLILVVD